MVEATGSEQAAGITRLSGYLARYYQPLFLHRNLQQALSYHEDQLRNESWNEKALMSTANQVEQSWRPPDRTRLAFLGARRQPDFSIQVKSLKPFAESHSVHSANGQKRARLARFDCEIEVTIWEIRPGKKFVSLVRDATDGRLQARQVDYASLPEFHVTMKPLVISTSRMVCNIGEDGDWRRGLASDYHLDICILFRSAKDARAYFDLAEPGRFADDHVIPRRTRLATKWKKFPKLPLASEPLPLHITLGDNRVATSYALDADMHFRVAGQSIMAEHNYLLKVRSSNARNDYRSKGGEAQRIDGRYVAKIIDSPVKATIAGWIKLGFVWTDREAFIVVKGFCCAICDGRRRFPSRETLLQHVRSSHDYFRSDIVEASHGRFAKLNLHYVVELSLAPQFTSKKRDIQPSKLEVEAARAIDWVAPKRPYDINKDLQVDTRAGMNAAPPKTKRQHASPTRPVSSKLSTAAGSSKSPADVKELPRRPRRKVVFPQIIGGKTAFKLDSKRPLVQGDVVSESDDDIDTDWIKPRRDKLTERAEMSVDCAAFSVAWNDYVERFESLSGDAYLGDATVRFLRRYADQFTDPAQNRYMDALLQACHTNELITDAFLKYGQEQLQQKLASPPNLTQQADCASEPSVHTPVRLERHKQACKGPAEAMADDGCPASRTRGSIRKTTKHMDSPIRATPSVDGDPMDVDSPIDRNIAHATTPSAHIPHTPDIGQPAMPDGVHCICGDKVANMYRIVICANLNAGCRQPRYHMKCLNLKRRDPKWLCPLCVGAL